MSDPARAVPGLRRILRSMREQCCGKRFTRDQLASLLADLVKAGISEIPEDEFYPLRHQENAAKLAASALGMARDRIIEAMANDFKNFDLDDSSECGSTNESLREAMEEEQSGSPAADGDGDDWLVVNEGHETSESGFDVKYARARKDHSDAKKKLAQLREGLILKMAQMRTKEDLGEADSLGYIMLQGEVDTQLETITMQEADVERASKYLRELEASGKI